MSDKDVDLTLEDLEIDLLLEAVRRYYGYDFRDYEIGAVRQRIRESMLAARIPTISRLQEKILHNSTFLERFLRSFSGKSLSMFSDPELYRAFRERVVPHLKTYAFVRIWIVGCSTGEEAYSIAILLHEEGLLQRSRLYATDMSEEVVKQARAASFSHSRSDEFEANYLAAGGHGSILDYFQKKGRRLVIEPSLKKNMLFSEHNLSTDGSFNEFQVIICRDVLKGFNQKLKERVDRLIYDSLSRFGVLALGSTESLNSMPYEECYSLLDEKARLYQKHGSTVIPSFANIENKNAQRC